MACPILVCAETGPIPAAPSNIPLQPTPTRHSNSCRLFRQRGRVGAAERYPLGGRGDTSCDRSEHRSPSQGKSGRFRSVTVVIMRTCVSFSICPNCNYLTRTHSVSSAMDTLSKSARRRSSTKPPSNRTGYWSTARFWSMQLPGSNEDSSTRGKCLAHHPRRSSHAGSQTLVWEAERPPWWLVEVSFSTKRN